MNSEKLESLTLTGEGQVHIFQDRVEIINPGGLVGGLTLETLGTRSIPRNPLLFGMMQRMELVEKVGSDLKRVGEMCRNYPCALPKIESDEEWCHFILRRPSSPKGSEKTSKTTQETTQGKILNLIQRTPAITRKVLASEVGITDDGIKYHLDKMRKTGVLRHVGPTKGGHWEVLK